MSIILLFKCSILGPSQWVNHPRILQPRGHKEPTIHQYPRQRSEEHENPMNNITPNTPMLQPIPHECRPNALVTTELT